ncbi:MAG TPA: biotin carboxylase N-terminal domain-containing protein [Microbacteriaceae bacterium]|nr:biotin carboxylase N-terminal domain-containing protein [Microbacteriaceae bacterium]
MAGPDSRTPPFRTVLVANRGEIARRVIRTLRRLGIRSVAVYSDVDATAAHVDEADEAVRIGPGPARSSYLRGEAVIAAALERGAQAIHPGYGFLSENADFARACAAAGVVFVGPSPRALEVMGDKVRAKTHVAAYGVPVIPGASESATGGRERDAELIAAAAALGYPLLVKPSAGGGGKGMQEVRSAAQLPGALMAARRIATAAFGDDTLLLERLVERPRHIEVQVLADAHGAVIHLGERECTLQRRHQKVVEEAPSPLIDPATRARLGEAACAAARSVDYLGAGTVEFLVAPDAPGEFAFIEMNTRLQVEHAVTELVTGIDLVEQQLRIAAGEPLAIRQEAVRLEGHAVEARVYAESPERGFLPATGRVLAWHAPRGAGLRVDAAIRAGDEITAHYDPMIAKVVAHGGDRAQAIDRLDAALAETVLLGVETNVRFLRALLAADDVRAGDLDTGLIERMPALDARTSAPPEALEAAAAALLQDRARSAGRGVDAARDAGAAPLWLLGDGWRIGGAQPWRLALSLGDGPPTIVEALPGGAVAASTACARADDGHLWVHAGGDTFELRAWSRRELLDRQLASLVRPEGGGAPEVRAPMPGTVVALAVADGAEVEAGAVIATIEAMKMEHPAVAAAAGTVRLEVAIGDRVSRDQVLARVLAAAAGTSDDGGGTPP